MTKGKSLREKLQEWIRKLGKSKRNTMSVNKGTRNTKKLWRTMRKTKRIIKLRRAEKKSNRITKRIATEQCET